MSAIAVTADGAYIYLALENGSGQPVIVRAARSDLSTWTAAYNPAAGTAANVLATGDPDRVLFYGNFGSGVQVVEHTVSTGAETNISPAGLAAKVVNGLAVNPSDPDEIIISVDTDQDLQYTSDGGANWSVLNAALGVDATALAALWSGAYEADRAFIAGNNGSNLDLLYTPNAGSSLADYASGGLATAADICGVEVTEVIT